MNKKKISNSTEKIDIVGDMQNILLEDDSLVILQPEHPDYRLKFYKKYNKSFVMPVI